ncbi:MAG: hypothetical protein PHS14_00055 [Elusimicrobia bacterium]|nr:hypothetical protein [Elusimicrobiota bacterium]
MENDPPADQSLARIVVPEIVDIDIIRNDLGPSIDRIIARSDSTVAKLAVGITDDATMELAVKEAESLRDNGEDLLKGWRETFYMEAWYRPGEAVRELFDPRLKKLAANKKTLLGHVADYKARKEREAKLARERAEAEARRQREAAEKAQRDAEEAERRAQQAAEDEKRRKEEAEAAERRRIAAEAEAKERRDREAREAAAAETKRKLDEEERSRLAHAEVAEAEGNGAAKVDTILESATPIGPVLGKAEQADSLESVRLEQENARKVADEKAARDRAEAEEAERKRKDAEAEAFRKREEADRAAQAATAAAAAAAATGLVKKEDTGTTGTVRWKWDLESDGTELGDIAAVMAIIKAVLDGIVPIEYIGYNRKRPQDFRPTMIGEDVTDKKDRFSCPGIRAYPQQDEQLKRRVGGRR